MSARNRELLALIPASLLLTAGFAAVFIQRDNVLSNVSLTYGAIFLGLCLAAHIVIRFTLPHADPYLFPLVAVLACFGLVMIYRIDEDLAREQAQWFVVGLILFAATIILLRDYRVLERYRYMIAAGGIALLLLPRVPGIGAAGQRRLPRRRGSARCRSSRPSSRRSRSSSSWPATCATRASCWSPARGGSSASRSRRSSTSARCCVVWGVGDGDAVLHPGHRLVADVLRRVPGASSTSRRTASRSSRSGCRCSPSARGSSYTHPPTITNRVDAWQHPFGAALQQAGRQLPARPVAVRAGRRRAVRPGLRPGAAHGRLRRRTIAAARGADRPHLRGHHRTSSGCSARPRCCCTYLLVVERGFKIAMLARDSFSKLLATGLTAVFALQVFVIVGGVTQRHPADRRDAAVRLLRRLVDPRQLRAAGAAAARLRPRAARSRGADDERADHPPLRRLRRAVRACSSSCTSRWTRCSTRTRCATTRRTARQLLEQQRIRRGTDPRRATASVLARSRAPVRRHVHAASIRQNGLFAQARRLLRSRATAAPASSSSRNDALSGRRNELGVDLRPACSGTPAARATTCARRSTRRPSASRCRRLAGRKGAVVALDPQTGAIKVMASVPSYDPNAIGQPGPLHAPQPGPGRAAAQPHHAGRLPAGLDVQGRHRDRGDRQRQVHAELARQRAQPASRSRACRCATTRRRGLRRTSRSRRR